MAAVPENREEGLIAALAPPVRVVAFDAYGTLFDVHAAVARLGDRIGPEAAAFSALWRAKQLEYAWVLSLAGVYEDFWSLTRKALDFAFASFPGVDAGLRAELLAAYRALDAYPDAAAALGRLRAAGLRTAILSNGEPAMLQDAVTAAGLGALLDEVLSVEMARVFKTDRRAYALVCEAFGVAPHEVMFVSSNRWDVAGAAAFGFAPVWANRAGQPPEYPGLAPVATVASLAEIA